VSDDKSYRHSVRKTTIIFLAKVFLIAIACLIAAGLIIRMAGLGPPVSRGEIRDWHDLDAIRANSGGSYVLMNDLDSSTAGYGKDWQPIGPFTGTFDGQGFEIRDLFINHPDESSVGLFGEVGQEGVIKDIGVVNAVVTGNGYVGGLVGVNFGTVSNSYFSGNVTGNSAVGGLVGDNSARGNVSNSCSTSSVTGNSGVGGLAGYNLNGTISDCHATGKVTGNLLVGGLVGTNYKGTVSNSFWDMETSGQATSAGGTGKTTTEMKDIATFSGAGWNIIAVALNETNPAYIWNIVNNVTYPFLSWQPV
jgi:hypothetical protein